MTFSFKGKVVAVTGAARGLGRVTALGSDKARYIQGHTLVVDGGFVAQ